MGCGRITRAGECAKLLEAAYGPIRVPVPTVDTSQGDIGEDFRLKITGGCRGRSRLVGGSMGGFARMRRWSQTKDPSQLACYAGQAPPPGIRSAPGLLTPP